MSEERQSIRGRQKADRLRALPTLTFDDLHLSDQTVDVIRAGSDLFKDDIPELKELLAASMQFPSYARSPRHRRCGYLQREDGVMARTSSSPPVALQGRPAANPLAQILSNHELAQVGRAPPLRAVSQCGQQRLGQPSGVRRDDPIDPVSEERSEQPQRLHWQPVAPLVAQGHR